MNILKNKSYIRIFPRLSVLGISVILVFFLVLAVKQQGFAVDSTGIWVQASNMLTPHHGAGTILLDNGKILETTGANSSGLIQESELFDPITNTWSLTGNVNQARAIWGNVIAKLPDGRVLIAGGEGPNVSDLASAELYDSNSGTWSYTGSLNTARRHLVAIRLQNGKVLAVAGANGVPDGNRFLASTELYDPATGQWTYTGNLNVAREPGNIVLLHDGRAMVAGGEGPWYVSGNTAELYDPTTGQWALTSPMIYGWVGASMTVLNDGRVLVAGGSYNIPNLPGVPFTSIVTTQQAMLYDPAANTWVSTAPMSSPRSGHSASLLSDGKVLVTGGSDGTIFLKSSEVYDPITGQWTLLSNGDLRQEHVGAGIVTMSNGNILIAGGDTTGQTSDDVEIFANQTLTPTLTPTPTTKKQANLKVTKNAAWKTVSVNNETGGFFTYNIDISNDSSVDASNVNLVDNLPSELFPIIGNIVSTQGSCPPTSCSSKYYNYL